jgi:hypothetical protein
VKTKPSTDPKVRCTVCSRDTEPKITFHEPRWECSHVDCPHRRSSWSERPEPPPSKPDGIFNPYAKYIPEDP